MLDLLRGTRLAPLLEEVGPVVFDVGARGGLDEDFATAAWATTMVGFEPEPKEAVRLAAAPDRRWRYVLVAPIALGQNSGPALLHLPESPAAASLRPHNPAMVERFGHPSLHQTLSTVEVDTRTFDDAVSDLGLPQPDYLKLDIEGAELDVLKSGTRTLQSCSALKVECAFIEQRLGQALAHDVIGFLAGHGFELAEIRDAAAWRRRPIQGHPLRIRHPAPYSRAQLAQADLIFLRATETIVEAAQAKRFLVTAAVLGFIDHGVSLLRTSDSLSTCRETFESFLLSASKALGAAASRRMVRDCSRQWLHALKTRFDLTKPDPTKMPY